ncbi:MAG TPA: tRNA (guanosine(46)-N(7))-methyltransferase TrmB [Hyphomicrobiales bacterium]|nr:tRNA (guanosine(46)-N(7))-methyltransferase TrmB [Hyphomicrobiales bacterium]
MAADDLGGRAFFGRRKGKKLRPAQSERLAHLLPALSLSLDAPSPADLRTLFPVPVSAMRLEIGFGGAEHLLHEAAARPDIGFVGIEPFVNGMAKALAGIEAGGLRNVRLSGAEASAVLDWLPPAGLDRVDLLYPDPWPKQRHWKRRFVSADNLARLARALRPGGEFRFASDIPSYVEWTLRHAAHCPDFSWQAERADDWRRPWPGWAGTRYEAKALREGRVPTYLTFRRR